MADDVELLRRYAKDGCAKSFELIVRRHIGWVYSASLRQLGDAALAEDVTQSVFVLLERKVASFKEGVTLTGWLFNTLRFASREARRKDTRRRKHEARAAVHVGALASSEIDEAVWEKMSPLLEEAVGSLGEADRSAVLLRFYEGSDFAAIGTALGVTEVTARKRVSRAVKKLGAYFKQKGVMVPAVVLASALFARAAEVAPGGLIEAVLSGAGGSAPVAAVGTLVRETAMRFIKGRRRLAAAIVACMSLLGVGLWILLVAWMVRAPREGEGARTDLLQVTTEKLEEKALIVPADDFDFANPGPARGKVRFDFGRPAARSAQPEEGIAGLDASWWMRQWYDLRNALHEPQGNGRGREGGEEELIDPKTGQSHSRSWFEKHQTPAVVPSFDVAGGGGGGGVSGRADGRTGAAGADAAPSRGAGAVVQTALEGAAIVGVVVASDGSATSMAADSPALGFIKAPLGGVVLGGTWTRLNTGSDVMFLYGTNDAVFSETGIGLQRSLAILHYSPGGNGILVGLPADQEVLHWLTISQVIDTGADGKLEIRPGASLAGLHMNWPLLLADLELYRSQNGGVLPDRVQIGDVDLDGQVRWSNVPEPGMGLVLMAVGVALWRRRRQRG